MKRLTNVLPALLAAGTIASAETLTLDTIEVTASERTGVLLTQTTSDVTVITREAIEEARVDTLAEAIARLGHIATASNGGIGQPTSFFLRGFDSKRLLVLIDGVRYNDVTGLNGAQFEQLPVGDVEQIEIIKGAQSGIWGADASAGVINIVTRKARAGWHVSGRAETGSFATRNYGAEASYADGRVDLLIGASRYDTKGYSAAEPTHASPDYGIRGEKLGYEADGFTNESLSARAGFNFSDSDRLELSARRVESTVEYDAGAGIDAENYDDPYGWGMTSAFLTHNDNTFLSGSYRHRQGAHEALLQYGYSSFERDQYGGYEGTVRDASLQDRYNYAPGAFVRFGGSYQRFEQTLSAGTAMDASYTAKSLYATNYNNLGKTIVTESLRYDRYSAFDDKVTGKLGIRYNWAQTRAVSLNAGTGYNVPTLYQLHDGYVGNGDIDPETTRSIDATLNWGGLEVTGFYNRVTNLIDYVSTGGWSGNFDNVAGTSVLQGVEVGYRGWLGERTEAGANYTYLNAKDAQKRYLARRPKHQLDMDLTHYLSDAMRLTLRGQYVGTRYDGLDKSGAQTGGYTVWHAVLNYDLSETVAIYGKMDNITDKYYQVVDGYATAGRSAYIGVRASY